MTHIGSPSIQASDSFSIDAFGRWRVSFPFTIFDSKQLRDSQPIFWDDQQISGGSTTTAHRANEACTRISVGTTTAGVRVRQTFQRFNYQPGKALEENEPVLTPNGFIPIKDLKIDDYVFDGLGNITKVVGIANWEDRNTYRITFDDGTWVDADEEHDWDVIIRQNSKKGSTRTISVKEMLEEYGEEPPVFARWKIPQSPILNIEETDVPVKPYALGAILGDGNIDKSSGYISFTTADVEILDYIGYDYIKRTKRDYHYGIYGLGKKFKGLGLAGKTAIDKFVPDCYLYNSAEIRLSVLQGLMDTDGTVDKHDGTAMYSSVSYALAENVAFLTRSLGGQAKIKKRKSSYRGSDGELIECLDSYSVRVIIPICPFRLKRKVYLWKPRTRICFNRFIHSIKPIGKKNTVCIEVESENHTFLTRNNVVTHNSQLVFVTWGNMEALTGNYKICGYGDEKNGLFFKNIGGVQSVVRRTYSSGTAVDNAVLQSSWNIDKMDGSGGLANPSDVDLDFTKTQIGIIDFEWLGVGRVRMGFVVDGKIYYCHEFLNANNLSLVYMSTPNLPIRYEIGNSGTGAADYFDHICASVSSEGGQDKNGILRHKDAAGISGLSTGTTYAMIGLRLKSTALDGIVLLENLSALCSTTNDQAHWEIRINPTIAGTFTYSDETNSVVQTATGAATNTVTGGTEIDGGYFTTAQSTTETGPNALRIGSSIAGVSDTIVLCCRPITNNLTVHSSVTWRELS